jgi:hypothetical protein
MVRGVIANDPTEVWTEVRVPPWGVASATATAGQASAATT